MPSWQQRAMHALSRLSRPPQEVMDVSTTSARIPTVEELCDAMIRRQLRARGLLPPPDGTATAAETEADEAWRLLGPPAEEQAEEPGGEDGGDVEPAAKRQRGGEGAEARQKRDGEPLPPGLLVKEEVQERWRGLARTASAELVEAVAGDVAHVTANRSARFCVYNNAVQGNPHLRWVERLAANHGVAGGGGLEEKAARVPVEVPRLPPGAVVLTVAVCNTMGHKDQEFDVLATQTLHDLRDALYFVSDWMFDGPTRIKSACFFIDGVFYSDMRDPTAMDYSLEYIEWLKQAQTGVPLRKDTSQSMDIRLCDLDRIPFGERCVYIHQGDIEQSVYFTGMRLVNPRFDCPFLEAYPVLIFMRRHMKRRCYACWQNFAVWIVLDSHRCPHNPSFWCALCFRHFHQDADGGFLCPVDYKVFPYLHDDV